jgi:7,8-dihydropterin-6-yl-methyl-4-(beta-D-ribofuranosyl)aminobenzene 5'-phosphate synthase
MNTSPAEQLKITILYDNNPFDQRLKTAWGFSALIQYQNQTVLFDTGGDGPTLLANMEHKEVDPKEISLVVLSHRHDDHTGGLPGLLDAGEVQTVYLLPSFPAEIKERISTRTEIMEAAPGQEISPGVYTTGEISGQIPEQALLIQMDQGLVILTGCAHPGIVNIVKRANQLFEGPVYLILGGFHLKQSSDREIQQILAELRALGVENSAPCHCTGEQAIQAFAEEYQENFVRVGAGTEFCFGPGCP